MKLDTTAGKKFIPLFHDKLGPNKPLLIKTSIKDVEIKFGKFDVDMEIEFTLCLATFTDTAKPKLLLYDEFKMLAELNVNLTNDVLFPKVKKF